MEKSRAEVERTLIRYGASGFAYSWDRRTVPTPREAHSVYCQLRTYPAGHARASCTHGCPKTIDREVVIVGFKMKTEGGERAIQLEIPMPHEREFNSRTATGSKAKAEAATRQRWRAVVLVLKAKLEAVASGISTLEAEFLANVVLGNGLTVGQAILPRLTEVVSSGRLLPAAGEAG
jgi:hypothetical protein